MPGAAQNKQASIPLPLDWTGHKNSTLVVVRVVVVVVVPDHTLSLSTLTLSTITIPLHNDHQTHPGKNKRRQLPLPQLNRKKETNKKKKKTKMGKNQGQDDLGSQPANQHRPLSLPPRTSLTSLLDAHLTLLRRTHPRPFLESSPSLPSLSPPPTPISISIPEAENSQLCNKCTTIDQQQQR